LAGQPLWQVLLLLAVIPAVAEEWLFRGFYLSGTAASLKKWSAIITVSIIFGIYHFMIDRIPVTALLGVMLAYLCWQSRSIFPGMIVHAMHNASLLVMARSETLVGWMGRVEDSQPDKMHLHTYIQIPAAIMFVLGILILISIREKKAEPNLSAES